MSTPGYHSFSAFDGSDAAIEVLETDYPPAVIARAEEVLAALETGQQSGAASRLADDLPLFQAVRPTSSSMAASFRAGSSPVDEALSKADPDAMTPRDALDFLYQLRTMLKDEKNV